MRLFEDNTGYLKIKYNIHYRNDDKVNKNTPAED